MSQQNSLPNLPDINLPLINQNAAGIDIGADRHWVSVPIGRDSENVHSISVEVTLGGGWLSSRSNCLNPKYALWTQIIRLFSPLQTSDCPLGHCAPRNRLFFPNFF